MVKKLALGCGGLIALFVVILIIAAVAGGSKSSTQSGVASSPAASSAAKASESAKPSDSAAQLAPLAKVGERVESSGVALTVNSVNKVASVNQFMRAKDGNTYIIADVTIENTSRDKSPYNPLYFKVKDADGYEYNAGLVSDDKALKSGELAAGEKARGTVAYEVPQAGKGFVLSYQPMVILGGYKVIRIGLE